MFLEGVAGVTEDQRQKVYGYSGIKNCPVGLNTWCLEGIEIQVYKNRQGKTQAVKNLLCHTGSAGLSSTDHVKSSEAFQQWVTWGFSMGRAWCLGEELGSYYNSPCYETGPDESRGVRGGTQTDGYVQAGIHRRDKTESRGERCCMDGFEVPNLGN